MSKMPAQSSANEGATLHRAVERSLVIGVRPKCGDTWFDKVKVEKLLAGEWHHSARLSRADDTDDRGQTYDRDDEARSSGCVSR